VGFLGFGDKFNAERLSQGKSDSSIRCEVLVGRGVIQKGINDTICHA